MIYDWRLTLGQTASAAGIQFTCWNGEIIRGTFIIDAHDREIISWRAVVNAGISGSDICDIMLEAVEARFGSYRTSHPIEMLSDNGSVRDSVYLAAGPVP